MEKFKAQNDQWAVAYTIGDKRDIVYFVAVGQHENFYRDVHRYLRRRIEEEAKKIPNTNFIVNDRFRSHAVRDGSLITGQQQYSGAAAARLLIEALGV